jgi:hypothetical protein
MKIIKNNLIKSSIAIFLGLLLGACSPKIIVMQNDPGLYTLTTSSAKEKTAMKMLVMKSMNICDKQNLSVGVINMETIYQGLDDNQQKIVNLADEILPSSKTSGPYVQSGQLYQAKLKFRCE